MGQTRSMWGVLCMNSHVDRSPFTGGGNRTHVAVPKNLLKALSNGAIPKLNFLVSGRVSVVMSTFSVFGLSYGRSGNEFCAEEGQNPIFDPLPRNKKLCGNL